MNLALGIVFLWIGCILLTIAFHQLPLENLSLTGRGKPGDVVRAVQATLAKKAQTGTGTAYDSIG